MHFQTNQLKMRASMSHLIAREELCWEGNKAPDGKQ